MNWESLRNSQILMTGGTGFFGHWLLKTWSEANQRLNLNSSVTVITRDVTRVHTHLPELAQLPHVHFIQGDVRHLQAQSEIFDRTFTHLIHAATDARATLTQTQPEVMKQTIIDGTRSILDIAKRTGIRRMLFTSSGAIYGPQPPSLSHVPEDFVQPLLETDPNYAYASGKRDAEEACTECVIARCFAFVGPYLPLDQHFAIGNFIRDGLAGRPIQVAGDGTALRSYLYAEDLAQWLWTLLTQGQSGRAYNVGSDEAISIGELAHKIGDLLSVPVTIAKTPPSSGLPPRYIPSIQRAKTELGLSVETSLTEAIKKTIQWHKSNK